MLSSFACPHQRWHMNLHHYNFAQYDNPIILVKFLSTSRAKQCKVGSGVSLAIGGGGNSIHCSASLVTCNRLPTVQAVPLATWFCKPESEQAVLWFQRSPTTEPAIEHKCPSLFFRHIIVAKNGMCMFRKPEVAENVNSIT